VLFEGQQIQTPVQVGSAAIAQPRSQWSQGRRRGRAHDDDDQVHEQRPAWASLAPAATAWNVKSFHHVTGTSQVPVT